MKALYENAVNGKDISTGTEKATHLRCIIISDYAERVGGAHSVAIDGAIALAAQGVSVVYLFGLGQADPCLSQGGVKVVRGPRLSMFDRLGVLFGWNLALTKFIHRNWDEQIGPCEIAHIHGTTRYFGFGFIRDLKRKKLKIVYTVHDYVPWCPVGTYYNHQSCKRCTLKPLSLQCLASRCDRTSYAHKWVRILRQISALRNLRAPWVDRWIFVSEVARATAQKLSSETLHGSVVTNPVLALPRIPRQKTSRPLFVYLGRICPEKGIHRLLSVAEKVDADFELVGEVKSDETLPLNVRMFAHADRESLARTLARANALILLSEWDETFGLVVAEAASCGVPSILSKYAGISPLLPADAVWIVDPFDEKSVIEALTAAMNETNSALRGARAQQWFRKCRELSPAGHAAELRESYFAVANTKLPR